MKTFHYELEKVNSYEILDDKGITWTNSVRIFAVGWPLKRYGWVWTRDRGIILAMANDPRHQVLLKMGKRLLLISPDSEGKLLRQLNAQRPAQA